MMYDYKRCVLAQKNEQQMVTINHDHNFISTYLNSLPAFVELKIEH